MRTALPAVATAALLVLAGCSGFAPNPNPGPEPTSTGPQYPPGVTADGLTDPLKLVQEHVESVWQRGASVEHRGNATVTVAGEPRTVEIETTGWASPGGERVYQDTTNARVGGNGTVRTERIQRYAANDTVVVRHRLDGNVSVSTRDRGDRHDRSNILELRVARASYLRQVLTAADFEVVDVHQRTGRTVTTLAADEVVFREDGRRVFEATLEVAAEGRVLSLAVTRDSDATVEAGRRTANVTWTGPPAPEPGPPNWAT